MMNDLNDDDELKYNKLSYHKQVSYNSITVSPDEQDSRHLRTLPVTSADNIRNSHICPHFTRWNICTSADPHIRILPPSQLTRSSRRPTSVVPVIVQNTVQLPLIKAFMCTTFQQCTTLS